MISKIFLLVLLIGGSGVFAQKRSPEHSHRESEDRSRVREVNDTYQSDLNEKESQEFQNALEQVLENLLWINSGREKTQITN